MIDGVPVMGIPSVVTGEVMPGTPSRGARVGRDSALPPDDVLVERLRSGDERAFRLLLDAWSGGMLRIARAYVSSAASAEEVVQETWLAVIRGVDGFEGRSALKTWVHRILINTAKARGRKESRTVPMEPTPDDTGPTVDRSRFRTAGDPYPGHWRSDRAPQPWAQPEELLLAGETRRVLGTALEALPPRYRVVITMRDIEGYGSDEVCSLLGISAGNQRVLLHRARAEVRRRLEESFAAREEGMRP